jgi:hypothetical protein
MPRSGKLRYRCTADGCSAPPYQLCTPVRERAFGQHRIEPAGDDDAHAARPCVVAGDRHALDQLAQGLGAAVFAGGRAGREHDLQLLERALVAREHAGACRSPNPFRGSRIGWRDLILAHRATTSVCGSRNSLPQVRQHSWALEPDDFPQDGYA